MQFRERHIEREVFNISASGPDLIRESNYDMILHVPEGDFFIQTIHFVDIIRDYANNYSDYVEIKLSMALGDFIHSVYPNRDKLEATITHYAVGNKTVERMLVLLNNIPDIAKKAILDETPSKELNQEIITFNVQCVNKSVNGLRARTTHGIYKNTDVLSVLSTILGKEMGIFQGFGGILNNGIEIVPPDNTRKYEHIIVPAGTKILSLPKVLQGGAYGVYNGDITTYLQATGDRETLYISPKYRTNLLKHFKEKLFIVSTGKLSTAVIESTYVKEGDYLKILVSKGTNISKDENTIRDKGTAVITTESDSITSRPVEITDSSMRISEANVRNKIAHTTTQDGIGPVDYHGVTNNMYKTRTNGLMNDGFITQVTWNASNSRLLVPMMPVIYLIEEDNELKQYEGVLHRVDTITIVPKKSESSKLTLFLKRTSGTTTIKEKIKIF